MHRRRVIVGLVITVLFAIALSIGAVQQGVAWLIPLTLVLPVSAYLFRGWERWPYICLLYGGTIVLRWLFTLATDPAAAWDLGRWSWPLIMLAALLLGTWLDRQKTPETTA
ncbi:MULTISPECIES: hypothetical protein [unclassified Corynebacterium]|uniref:hypothetical protein n=1 Tax=unclassified Corynebacterium TaxID=2624378 RepID=UPI0029C9BBF3|nr:MULTISPECIES: hypothetical protein [unclassified Corynebacterium]WPF66101.1 hypothetical protein OLX12_11235 [Corynebacterium sp. 22KM0430]WPF68593.1 hypothetical protein OLW90_11230 [Corynebacterium sp. 21KM1197]